MEEPQAQAARNSIADELADRIASAHAAKERFQGCRPSGAGLDLAYAVQDRLVGHFRNGGRGRPVGWKIGLTSARMQEFVGVDQPIAGVILADGVRRSPAAARLAEHGRLGLECEICLRTDRDLPPRAEPLTREEAAGLVAAIAPAFEMVDDRAAVYEGLDAFSIIADNSWNAGVVLGAERTAWPDLGACSGRFLVDGQVHEEGSGAEVLGHPLESLIWLASHLGRRGEVLPAGSMVMTGSMVRTHFPEAGRRYRFDLAGPDGESLGGVELAVE